MRSMLKNQLEETDFFSIIHYNTGSEIFTLKNKPTRDIRATKKNTREAETFVMNLKAEGTTNMNQALLDGFSLSEEAKKTVGNNTARMMILVSDGLPYPGTEREVLRTVRTNNTDKVPILTLGIGQEAAWRLLLLIS